MNDSAGTGIAPGGTSRLIAAGFVDTPLSASLLGDELDNRRNHLRATLPIRRFVSPADAATCFACQLLKGRCP